MRLLVVAAHVDDEVFLCGGTIAKARRHGHEVDVLFCSRNEQGRCAGESIEARVQRAEAEAAQSAAQLGFRYRFLDFEDMCLADQPGRLQQALIASLRELRPEVLLTHAAGDWHVDHRVLASAAPEAALQSARGVAGGEPWQPTALLHGEVDLEGLAALPVQVVSRLEEEDMETRQAAIKLYVSVASEHDVDATWLQESLRARARARGALVRQPYGEAFSISRLLPLDAAALRLLAELLA